MKSSPCIGIDISNSIDRRATGVARYIRQLYRALRQLPEPPELRLYCRLSRLRSGRPSAGWEGARIRWLTPIAPRGVEVFHAPDLSAPRRLRCPLVVTLHDLYSWTHSDHASAAFIAKKRAAYRRAAVAATVIITHTEAIRRQITESFDVPPARVFAVPLAAGLPVSSPASVQRENDLILVVGGPSRRKGSHRLGAILRLWTERTGWRPRVVWVGSGSEAEALAILADMPEATRSRVRFLGHVPDAELSHLYESATGLLNLSDAEGFGLPLLEAANRGCPVISIDTAPLREVLAAGAFWFDANDLMTSARRLCAFLDPAERARTQQAAAAQARRFDWNRTARMTLDVYRHAIEIFRPPTPPR